ncbi:MAG: hypothetical protein AB9917_10415 [Negativicutes bacterium]
MALASIRIDAELVERAKAVSKVQQRTTAQQIKYWATIGEAALQNPDLTANFIVGWLESRAQNELAKPFVRRHE